EFSSLIRYSHQPGRSWRLRLEAPEGGPDDKVSAAIAGSCDRSQGRPPAAVTSSHRSSIRKRHASRGPAPRRLCQKPHETPTPEARAHLSPWKTLGSAGETRSSAPRHTSP